MATSKGGLGGLWTFAQGDYVLDDALAVQEKHARPDGRAAPHGTYVRHLWYRIYHLTDQHVYVFDKDAQIAEFIWQSPEALKADSISPRDFRCIKMPEAWKSTSQLVDFWAPSDTDDQYSPRFRTGRLMSRLRLLPANDARPGLKHKWCPGAAGMFENLNAHPQYLYYDEDTDSLYWLPGRPDPDEEGLKFDRFEVPARGRGDRNANFKDTFAGQSHIAQLTYPFYGFNPRTSDFGSDKADLWAEALSPGTSALDYSKSNPMQDLLSALIFEFPHPDSYDYDRGVGIGDNPNLPRGLTGIQHPSNRQDAHTVEVSSTYDATRSWSTTCGFNAGIGKMLSVSTSTAYKNQVKTQNERQSRYTISRAITVNYIFWGKIPALSLQEKFLTEVHSRLKELLAGGTPRLENFVGNFGTHYVHAMTLGSLECSVTRYSLTAEVAARTKGMNLKTGASAALDAKGGVNLDFRQRWESSLGVKFGDEDVQSYGLGTAQEPISIFLDLRPITELFSPIFFPYNPADDWGRYSPLVWYGLRASMRTYLAGLGLNEPLERSADDDFTPRLMKLTAPTAEAYIDDREGVLRVVPFGLEVGMFVTGMIQFEQVVDPPPPADTKAPETPTILTKGDRAFHGERVDGGRYRSDEGLFCLIATRRGKTARVKMKVQLDIKLVDDSYPWKVLASFNAERLVDEGVDKVFRNEVNWPGRSVYFNLHLNLKWDEVPWA